MSKKDIGLLVLVIIVVIVLNILLFGLKIKEYINEKQEIRNMCIGQYSSENEKYIFNEDGTYTFTSIYKSEEGNYKSKNREIELTYHDNKTNKEEKYSIDKDYKCTYIKKDGVKYNKD